MKLSPVSSKNPNFKAGWSKETLALADKVDQQEGTQLRKELEEALEKNPELKNYGGDEVELTLGIKPNWKQPRNGEFTVCIGQNFDDYGMVRGKISPISYDESQDCKYMDWLKKDSYRGDKEDFEVLQRMAKDKNVKQQILNTVSKCVYFKAGLADSIGEILYQRIVFTKYSSEFDKFKSRNFDTFIKSKY